ncbi:MAG: mechanosensitive ion channel, partial [Gammaproteobacteria bacterium]|nr:mechanosensitive ion channel [Gammaproteobacteria bacterium]
GKKLTARMTEKGSNPDVVHLVQRIYFVVVLLIFFFTILELLNVPLTSFAFISGAIAIGIGFGAQNIINNFISGWILLWERPIRIGDFLEVGETRGTVESINTRSTRIRRVDGVHMLVPNSHLLENTVVNWTLIDRLARSEVRVGVAYGSPVEQVRELIQRAADEHPEVLKTPEPMVWFEDFGDSALVFDLVFWAQSDNERGLRAVRSDLRFRIDALFREHDIVISFPQRDVHLSSLSPLQVKMVGGHGDENNDHG